MKTLAECIEWAKEKGVAIGHFNISDSEGFKAIVDSIEELSADAGFQVPVIVGVSEGERDFIGLEGIAALVKAEREKGHPVFLNADHTYSVEKAKMAIEAGFDSVIIDGAAKSFEEDVAMTREVVEYARTKNPDVLVEGELGFIGEGSKLRDSIPEGVTEETQTKAEDAKKFVDLTHIDLLAPSVGNIHGLVKGGEPDLNIRRIKEISSAVSVPLVLHGASGNSDSDIIAAIDAGIRIVHINTEIRLAYKQGIEEGIKGEEAAPYKFMQQGVEFMKKVIVRKLRVFNKIQ